MFQRHGLLVRVSLRAWASSADHWVTMEVLPKKKGGQSAAILVKTWTRAIDMSMSLHNNNIAAPSISLIEFVT